MQLLIPQLELVFVPILKNASRVLTRAIQERWPDAVPVGEHIEGERVVMWRNPKDRIESAYKMRRDQGIEEDFSRWVVDVCTNQGLDPHLKPQLEYCQNPLYVFRWDFDGFRRLFKLRRIEHENESGTDVLMDWTDEATQAFRDRYKHDLRIWERK